MKENVLLTVLLAALLLPAAARAQAPDSSPGVRASPPGDSAGAARAPVLRSDAGGAGQTPRSGAVLRRQRLQQQVVARFLARARRRLGLSPAAGRRLEDVVRANDVQRRRLAREARIVRRQLVAAVRDTATPQPELERLLDRMAVLRERDLELWRAEQAQLAGLLTPRQRAQFMVMRLAFFDLVQGIRQQRRAAPGLSGLGPR